ncbi:MAG: hypothetical protein AB7R90_19220 [Reyranellaceae bacterium]
MVAATARQRRFAPDRFDFAMAGAADENEEPQPVALLADEAETVSLTVDLADVERLAFLVVPARAEWKPRQHLPCEEALPPAMIDILATGFELTIRTDTMLSLFVSHEEGRLELLMDRDFAADFAAEFRAFACLVEAERKARLEKARRASASRLH